MTALATGRTVEGKPDFPFYAGAPVSITGPGWLLVTRNLWVSAGAHIVNYWTEFFGPLALAGLAGHAPIKPGA